MSTLEKIKAEIQKVLDAEGNSENARAQALALFWVLELIDKYAEQEPKVTTTSTDEPMVMQYPQVDGITPTVVKAEQEPTKREIEREYLFQSLCEDFKKLQAENDDLIKRLEQEPCDDAISREDAIKAQCEVCDICGNTQYTKCQYFMQGCNEVKCLRDLPSVRPQEPKWIPISERLPEDDTEVLITYIYGGHEIVNVSWINNREWYYGNDIRFDKWVKVIAWMPLPKPYEPRESEDKE